VQVRSRSTPASATVDFSKDELISAFRELLNDQDLDQTFGDFIVPTASLALQATSSSRHEPDRPSDA
jgi:hypothetical protein